MEDIIAFWVTDVMRKFMTSVESIVSILGQDLTANSAMWGLVGQTHNIVSPICYTIITIFFLIEFLKMSMKVDVLKWEFLFRVMAKFVIAKACIDHATYLMEAIYSTAAEWITEWLNKYGMTDSIFLSNLEDAINDALLRMGFWEMVGFAITSIIPALVLLVCSFIIKVIAYGRMIELYILLAMMPVPFAFLLESEGGGNITKKYVLNFAGVCIQGLLIVIASTLYQNLMSDVITNMGTSTDAGQMMLTMVLGAIVMVLAVSKCGQWGKQLLNAM